MSDSYIRVIGTSPRWSPTPTAAAAAVQYVTALYDGPQDAVDEVKAEFHQWVEFIDSGVNTSTVSCPTCGDTRAIDWIFEVIGERHPDLTDLDVSMPCCGEATR